MLTVKTIDARYSLSGSSEYRTQPTAFPKLGVGRTMLHVMRDPMVGVYAIICAIIAFMGVMLWNHQAVDLALKASQQDRALLHREVKALEP